MATPKLALIPTGYKAGKVYSVLPESGVGDFTFTRASEATRINSAGLLEVEATGVPRLEYPLIDGVVNGCPSLLLENQATNLITYPISFPNFYWIKSGASIEGNPSTAGSEQIVNGDLTNGITNWGLGSGGDSTTATIVTGNGHPTNAIRCVSTGASNRAYVYNTTDLYEEGKIYKFEFWYRSDVGSWWKWDFFIIRLGTSLYWWVSLLILVMQ